MARTRGGTGERRHGGVASQEQHGNSNDGNKALGRLREEIFSLKRRAYKSLLWSLRMDHQEINWELEVAIEEIKKALGISQSEHTTIVTSLDKDFSNFEAELNRRVRAAVNDFEPDVRCTNTSSFPERMETNEDESQNPIQYNESIVGKEAWIKWGKGGNFRRVVFIDYDLVNGAHEILHLGENLYEWLKLKDLLPGDIRFKKPTQEVEITEVPQDKFDLYETEQLIGRVKKVLTDPSEPAHLQEASTYLKKQRSYLDTGLKVIDHRIRRLREQEHQVAEDDDNDDGGDNVENMVNKDNEDDDDEDQEDQYDSSDSETDGNENNEGSDDDNGGDGASGDMNDGSESDDPSSD